jgi:hypothetical protein
LPRIIWIFLTVPKLVGPPLAESAFNAVFKAEVVNDPAFSTSPKIFTFKPTSTKKKKEKGCTEPLYGKKSKCVINIVPQEDKIATFQMDEKCIKTRE